MSIISKHNETPASLAKSSKNDEERIEHLKGYIRRVGSGEDLEKVRGEFADEFASVSVHDIVRAEQGLIRDGMDQKEVQKLCDLHSGLFHGKTEAEVWQEEEQAAKAKAQEIPVGHPVDYFHQENAALEKLVDETLDLVVTEDTDAIENNLKQLKKIRILYGKKEELLLPLLAKRGITGPVDVMWGVDGEIKTAYGRLSNVLPLKGLDEISEELLAVLGRTKEMIYKEEKILYPLCLEQFTQDEWVDIYRDLPEMGNVFIREAPVWKEGDKILAERRAKTSAEMQNGVLRFPNGGQMTMEQLQAVFSILPVDITFIDENDINRFFVNNGKVFSRPTSALNRPVYDCHPKQIKPIVKKMISEFKAGTKDQVELWVPNLKKAVRILYKAVRDENGKYVGTCEIVQDCGEMKKHIKL